MRFWFARDNEVPIREQLVTQVILGILGDELSPGEKLPSTRELARRFRLHPNTISAGYRELERLQWVEMRHGSGVYVRAERPDDQRGAGIALDQQINNLFRTARELGTPLSLVRQRLRHWLTLQPPDHFLLIEPDEELRAIVETEIKRAVKLPVLTAGMDALRTPEQLSGAIVATLPSKSEKVRKLLPQGVECLTLKVRSVPTSLAQWLPAKQDILIGVASRWSEFLKTARTMLIAAGFPSDSLVVRDARKAGWQRAVSPALVVICDCVTAAQLPASVRKIEYPVLAQEAMEDLRRFESFVSAPLD